MRMRCIHLILCLVENWKELERDYQESVDTPASMANGGSDDPLQQELRATFPNMYRREQVQPIPRGTLQSAVHRARDGVCSLMGAESCASRSTNVASSSLQRPRSVPYSTFNPRHNYMGNPRNVSGRASVRRALRQPIRRSGRKFNRSIVVVDSQQETVPRGTQRQVLHSKGLIVGFVDLWTHWNEDEVFRAVEEALDGIIDASKPYPRFEYLQASSGKLIKPNVPPGHKWSGDKVQRLAGQGDIYIRPTYACSIECSQEDLPDVVPLGRQSVSSESTQHNHGGHVTCDTSCDVVHSSTPHCSNRFSEPSSSGRTVSAESMEHIHGRHVTFDTTCDMVQSSTPHCSYLPSEPSSSDQSGHHEMSSPYFAQQTSSNPVVTGTSQQQAIQTLQDMFPALSEQYLTYVLEQSGWDRDVAAGKLIDKSTSSCTLDRTSSSASLPSDSDAGTSNSSVLPTSVLNCDDDMSSEELLRQLSTAVLLPQRYNSITIERKKLWRTALGFYKNSVHSHNRLRYQLSVEFDGEEGVDAGALRMEFFHLLLSEVNQNLFEGPNTHRIPKKDSNLQRTFETAGIMIAHSILQGGPGFPCLCPAAVSYLLHMDKERALQECPSMADIPENASTSTLLSFITELDHAQTNEEIDSILDKAENMAIVDASNWSPTELITIHSKGNLLQELIYSEVIDKRHVQLKALRKGLDYFGLISLCKKHPQKLKHIFVHSNVELTSDTMLSLIEIPTGLEENEAKAVQWLFAYIECRSQEDPGENMHGKTKANLGDILQFITSVRQVPPLGFSKKITITFFGQEKESLPVSEGCFNILILPTNIESQEQFYEKFDQAVLYSMYHFGQE